MKELFDSKKFTSAVVGVVVLIFTYLLFGVWYPHPEFLSTLIPAIAAIFGLQIAGQGLADWGKEKEKLKK